MAVIGLDPSPKRDKTARTNFTKTELCSKHIHVHKLYASSEFRVRNVKASFPPQWAVAWNRRNSVLSTSGAGLDR